MPGDADAGIVGQHALEAHSHLVGAVGDDHLTGVERVADAHASAVVERDPGGAVHRVHQRVQDRPIGDRVGAVFHAFGFTERRRD